MVETLQVQNLQEANESLPLASHASNPSLHSTSATVSSTGSQRHYYRGFRCRGPPVSQSLEEEEEEEERGGKEMG